MLLHIFLNYNVFIINKSLEPLNYEVSGIYFNRRYTVNSHIKGRVSELACLVALYYNEICRV